jgi:MFS family permease
MAGPSSYGNRRALLAIIAEGFLSRLSFGVLNVALPLYARSLGMSLGAIGLLIALNTIVAIALKPAMGALADRFSYKRSLNVAVVLRSVVTVLLAVATVPWQLFAARSVHGVSVALRDPVVGALIAEYGGKKRMAQSFAWYQTAKSVAGNAGKALAPLLLVAFSNDFSLVFLAATLLSAIPIIVVVVYVRDPPRDTRMSAVVVLAEERPPPADPDAQVPKKTLASFVGLGFMISATANMLSGLFPLIVVEYAGLPLEVLSVLYVIGTLAALTGPGWGWVADNVGNRLVLSVRSFCNVFSSVLYIAWPTLAGIATAKALDDTGKAAFKPAWGSMMAKLAGRDKRRSARMFGYMTAGEDTGEVVAPIVAGAIASGWGFPVMFGVRIALAVATEVYSVVVTHRYLDDASDPERKTFKWRIAVPVRIVLGVITGFGAGWLVNAHGKSSQANTPLERLDGGGPAPAERRAPPSSDPCTSDNPTIREIQKKIGNC